MQSCKEMSIYLINKFIYPCSKNKCPVDTFYNFILKNNYMINWKSFTYWYNSRIQFESTMCSYSIDILKNMIIILLCHMLFSCIRWSCRKYAHQTARDKNVAWFIIFEMSLCMFMFCTHLRNLESVNKYYLWK